MKKIFVFLFLMIVSFALKAQYPIQQNLGGDSTIIYIKGAARTVGGFINGTYTDTAAANLTRIRQYQAAQIFTTGDSAMWFRSVGATKWIKMNAGGGGSVTTDTFYWRTGGNYITDTAGYRGILGTINNKPLIFMTNNQKRLILTEDGLQNLGTTNKGFMMYDTTTGVWSYAAGGSGVYTAGNGTYLDGSQFKLGSPLTENTTIDATGYDFNLPGIPTVSSTTGRKVALIDTTTGKVEKIDPASLVTTPTLQQVLTAGSTLTDNNIIYGNGSSSEILLEEFEQITLSASGTGDSKLVKLIATDGTSYNSSVEVRQDSISIMPRGGIANIDSLRTWSGISDTLYKKPMTWDTRNGRWEYAANWPQQKINLVFGAGSGADGDTTAFTTSAIYGSFYNDADTIVVTSMRSVLQGTSPDVTYKVWYNDSLNVEAGATALVTAGSQVTNTTTGTNVTSFDVTKIPPGNWVWVKTSTVATKPKYFSLTLNGYRK